MNSQKIVSAIVESTRAALRSRVSFSRVELAQMENTLGSDTIAGWVGLSIGDATLRAIAEDSARLAKVSFVGSREGLLLASLSREGGLRLGVWNVSIAKDGDTWQRQIGAQVSARGSLKTLRGAIAKGGTAQFGVVADLVKLAKTIKIDARTLKESGHGDSVKVKEVKTTKKTDAKKGAKK